MSPAASTWATEAAAVFVKDWRCELRTRYAFNTVLLFAVTTLVVVSVALGPLGTNAPARATVLPMLLWLILLFAAAAGLPRVFGAEEEKHTATALRLAATPSALFAGKLAYSLTLFLVIEAVTAPLFVAMMQMPVARPLLFVAALAGGGYGLAAGSTLVASIVGQARGQGTLFAVLSFPILLPLMLLAIEVTRVAVTGVANESFLLQLLLYDASVTIAGLMLFPAIWNP
ncbi:MAG: heme exporter protein CcmB [Holophagales bacterium]|nr:MAG: heme exporter protein CcmB [Holophagales bacterium]